MYYSQFHVIVYQNADGYNEARSFYNIAVLTVTTTQSVCLLHLLHEVQKSSYLYRKIF